MPRLKESETEQKNRRFRAELLRQMELLRLTRMDIAKVWGVSKPTAYKKLNDPGAQTVAEMRILCKMLHIPPEVAGQFIVAGEGGGR